MHTDTTVVELNPFHSKSINTTVCSPFLSNFKNIASTDGFIMISF